MTTVVIVCIHVYVCINMSVGMSAPFADVQWAAVLKHVLALAWGNSGGADPKWTRA